MGKITKNYIYNLGYQLFSMLVPIVTAPYLARVLGADQLGIYSYVNSSSNIVFTISMLGTYAYGNRQVAYTRGNPDKLNQTFWEVLIARGILGIFGTAFFVCYSLLNQRYLIYFILYYPYVLSNFIDCTWLYVGLEEMKTAVIKNFVCRILNVIGIFTLVRGPEDLWIYISLLAGTTFFTMVIIFFQLHQIVQKPAFSWKEIKKNIKESAKLFLPQIAALLYLQVDKVMIEWITHQTAQLSFYEQAEKIINIPLSIITVLGTVIMPRIANEYIHNNMDVIQALLLKAGKVALFMACPMMVGLFCVAEQTIPWYLGKEFMPVSGVMMILAPIVVLNALSSIAGAQYFTATNQIGIMMKAYVAAAVMNIICNSFLIPVMGCYGAAIATVLSSLASTLIQYFFLVKQIALGKMIGSGIKYFLCALLMGGAIFMLKDLPATPLTTMIEIIVGIIVYMALMLLVHDEVLLAILSKVENFMKN